ncbi:muramoyltetrapeptide carboxypeptidase [Aquabacterium sp. NJ1]|uniref:LD-carboxypeptidase n=1 Tax=Aquabacterium sp. NJ1 TaxID=1538295 RepID=UPI00052B639D|nr:LD-carboxypeptidase [Aquabacterium sp. NJ1]KGM41665.1 muramoyltetrapeptide carboxypeptidase [Aquabacterium sp. NJ1]
MTDARSSLIIFSPSGIVPTAAPVRKAAKRLQALGFDASVDESALTKHQRFAGDDDVRLAAIHRVAKAAPDVILATRGGYGLSRLLDRIDWKLLARSVERGSAWVGYSDVTALQLGALAHKAAGPAKVGEGVSAGFWAGPMACDDFGRADSLEGGDDVTQDCFVEAMTGELEAVGFRTEHGADGLEVSGRLWGGNLAIVQAMLGTPHFPKIKGGVLFLEDVNEHPYRIERALLQLHQAGVLAQQKAIVLGAFTEYRKSPLDRGYNLKSVIAYLHTQVKTPILTGLPFGHVPVKLSLPLGRQVNLVVQGRDAFVMW